MSPTAADDPQGLHGLLGAVLPLWSAQLDTLQQQLRHGLEGLLTSFTAIANVRDELEAELARGTDPARLRALGQSLAALSDQALHELQFGDRIHQLLDAVKSDQRRLESQLDTVTTLDAQGLKAWLERLRASYTTDEQHLTHRGQTPIEGRSSVDYF